MPSASYRVLGFVPDISIKDEVDSARYFFFCRSGTTVLTVGFTAPADNAFAGDLSFFGFLTSLLLR